MMGKRSCKPATHDSGEENRELRQRARHVNEAVEEDIYRDEGYPDK